MSLIINLQFYLLVVQNNDGSGKVTGEQLMKLYESFIEEYLIVLIEDPFDQDDWEHYSKFTATLGEKVQVVGDDLLVTNPKVCLLIICFPSKKFSLVLFSFLFGTS
jgi:enolase